MTNNCQNTNTHGSGYLIVLVVYILLAILLNRPTCYC